jgi:CheY-like chemotaxis protein
MISLSNGDPYPRESKVDKADSDKASVLVIDDSEIVLDVILDLLERDGISAIGLSSPIGASAVAVKKEVRVVVSDVNMPTITGSKLVKLFRDNRHLKEVKIALVSDIPLEDLNKIGADLNVDAVISKGRLDIDLVSTVQRLLRESNEGKPRLKRI